ncbi:MAG: hypothetical protein QG564_1842 [Campylobacterota bacterium]|nr:hypothetical protein [Campylobacterota bacterium]
MANSTTNLDLINPTQAAKEATANALIDAASPATLLGRRASTTTGLTFGYYGGVLNGDSVFNIANGTVTLTDNAVNYIQCNPATGVVSVVTGSFTSGYIPMYQVTTSGGLQTVWTDKRPNPLYTKTSTLAIKDEGTTLTGTPASINFTGSAVQATAVGNDVTVNVTIIDELSELLDVAISTPTNDQILKYSSALGKWINTVNTTSGDPWTYIKLTADQANTTTTFADIVGLTFAETSGVTYEIEGVLLFSTAASTTGIKLTSSFAAGSNSNYLRIPTTATAELQRFWTASDSAVTATTGYTAGANMIDFKALLIPSANGTFQLKFASEVAASAVNILTGSFIKFREVT